MKNFILGMLAFVAGAKAVAQTDPHFSQYYAYPQWMNPALTGVMDAGYRVTALYRSQWGNVGNGFSTPGVSADFSTSKHVNLGVNVLNQSTGAGGYNYMTAYASASYTGVRFGDNQITMGMAFGMINRRFDPSKFMTGDLWNPVTGPGAAGSSSELLDKTSAMSLDVGAGISYFDGTPDKKTNVFAGFSVYHLTQPDDPFFTDAVESKMPMRFTGHAGVRISITDGATLTPHLLYMKQGDASEKMIGAYAQVGVTDAIDFMAGANYRFKDAISPYVGFLYNSLILGVSYDMNQSQLGKVNGKANSFEISITFTGGRSAAMESIKAIAPKF